MAMVHRILVFLALAVTALAQGVAHRQVEVLGQQIHYLEAGSGPTVILLHGLGGDASNWALTVPALAPRYHVYVPDQIGFGRSDKPLINYRVATLVDFLDRFAKKLGITKATLVGNSLGGWVAVAYTISHPEQVERLVPVDSAGYSPARTGASRIPRELLLALNPSTVAGMKQVLNLILFNKDLITDEFAERAFTDKLRKNDGYTVNQFIESIARGEDFLDGKLGAIKTPTLIIWGREDELTPLAGAKALEQDIAGSRSLILDRCGHVPQMECAGEFNAGLLKFLSGAE
ncbi:MAG: alpha/beta fold hydrolase [Acidobacteria bacterium]|nr:alpha/beta fold hydrolase [Acidobacteriota bacterium]